MRGTLITIPAYHTNLVRKVREALPSLAGDEEDPHWDFWSLLHTVDEAGAFDAEGCSNFGAYCAKLASEFPHFTTANARAHLRIYRGFPLDILRSSSASLRTLLQLLRFPAQQRCLLLARCQGQSAAQIKRILTADPPRTPPIPPSAATPTALTRFCTLRAAGHLADRAFRSW